MALPRPIAASQTDAKSPVDDDLMDSIREDLNYLDTLSISNSAYDYEFKINGPLYVFRPGQRRRLDGALITRAQTFTRARLYLEQPGTSGTLEIDVRKYRRPNVPIISIQPQFSAGINSIAQVAPALATQSVSLVTPTIATQSISQYKSSIGVDSIILLGSNLVRYNFSGDPDADWKVGDSVVFSGCTSASNNGTFVIVRVGDDGANNLVVTNASGVAQVAASGTATLAAWSYNYVNPVDASIVAGESIVMSAHTTPANDGTFTIYAVNSGGNNIVVKNPSGVAQAGIAGIAQTTRWLFAFLVPANSTDFVVGESARMTGHTSGANNGDFVIRAVNFSGNNLVVSNNTGVAQGAASGTVNTTRWIYALPIDPTGNVDVGHIVHPSGTTSAANAGYFEVKEVNRLATNNIVVSNVNGVAQGGAAGTMQHTRMVFSFSTDQSSIFSTSSKFTAKGCVDPLYNTLNGFDVVEVNRGGGSNYNVVAVVTSFAATSPQSVQSSPAGRIILESKSIFVNRPTLALPTSVTDSTNRDMQYDTKSGVGDFTAAATVVAGDVLAVDLIQIPAGSPANVVVQLA